jgi:hypothetical protein
MLDRLVGGLEQRQARLQAAPQQPGGRAGAGRGAKAPCELTRREMHPAGEVLDADPFVQPSQRPLHRSRHRVVGRGQRNGKIDELRLPAVALGGHDHAPGYAVGHHPAVILAHQVQAQVDPRGRAGRGEDVVAVHIEHVRRHLHARKPARQERCVAPVGGGAAAVQQAGGGEHEGARADGHQPCSARVGAAQRLRHPPRRVAMNIGRARDDDRVRSLELLEAVIYRQAEAAHGGQQSRSLGAHREGVPMVRLELRPRQREHLGRHPKLERRDALVCHHRHPVGAGVHVSIVAPGGI